MTEELQGGMGIGADVILEFDKSIKNIAAFGEQMELLDARFGKLDSRIDAMKNSLSALSSQTSRATGSDLRKNIEKEVNALVQSNGIALSSVGSAPLKIKQDTVRHLFGRVDAELNRAILKQIGNVNIKIDPAYNSGSIPIGKDEFDELNKEIARLVKVQVKNLVNSVSKNGASMLSDEDLTGLKLDIGKGTVKQILLSIKNQITPLLTNPEVSTEGMKLTLNQKDLGRMMNVIKDKIKDSLDFDFQGILAKGNDVDAEIYKSARKIDSIVEDYAKNMRLGIQNIDPRTVEVPMKTLSKRLQKHIADGLNVSPQELNNTLKSIDVGSAHGYELQRQFSSLERTVNSKISSGTSKMVTELKQSVRAVEIQPDSNLKHYMIHEINKLNNEIVKKIRESIGNQFTHMRGELGSINTSPRSINRSGQMSSMARSGGGGGNTYNTYNNTTNSGSKTPSAALGSDPYARRDNYMNGFGLEGAVTNTLRHIVAGSMVGAPMMAMYQAMETFKTVQLENLKIMQNMSLKDTYRNEATGETNWGKVETDGADLSSKVKQMSNFYALDYGQMSQVAAVASRLTEDKEEAQQFTDQAAKIYRLDNESDLVGTIAPGLEAIMAQFKLSVWELDDVVNAFAVATNQTKATSDEVMKAMSRSGSALAASGVQADEAVALNAIAIQSSGQSGEVIGNMFKTVAARVTLPSVVDSLAGKGIDVYETNDMGLKERRSLIDILKDTAKVANGSRTGEDEISKIMLDEGGGYHYSKIMSFLSSMSESDSGMGTTNFFKMMDTIEQFQADPLLLQSMLSKTMSSPSVTMERAGVSVNNSLASILEELSPEIQMLSKNITNLAQGLENNASTIANIIGVLVNALVGFGAMYGIKRIGQSGNYSGHKENAEMRQRFVGGETLSRRQSYGANRFMNSHLLEGSITSPNSDRGRAITNPMGDRLSNKAFYNAAMKNDTLRPYMTELATMDKDRQRELRQYAKQNGRANSIPAMFDMMDASRGYRKPPKVELTADEMHQRSSFNARKLTDNKALANVFDRNFADNIVNSLTDRNTFDNLGDDDRKAANRLANMDDGGRRGFESYLDEHHRSTGRVIGSVGDLNNAMDDYSERTRAAQIANRQGSESYRDLSRAVRQVGDEASRSSRGGMGAFMDMIDTIPNRVRGAGGAIMGIARNIGSFAKQLGLALAVGDAITGSAQNSLLTEGQRNIRDHRTNNNDAADVMSNSFGEGTSMVDKLLGVGGLVMNSIRDWYTPGDAHVGVKDAMEFDEGFKEYLGEEYGVDNYKDAVEIENKKRKAKAKEEGSEYYDEIDSNGMMKQYLDDSGKSKELQVMEEEEFIKQYQQFAISQGEQDERQRKAEDARKAWEEEQYADGQLQYFSVDQMKARIEQKVGDVQQEGSLSQMNALLQGMKSDSAEYLKLRLEVIQQERDAYKVEMDEINKFVQERRDSLNYLEENGRRYTGEVDEDGNKIETDEYIKEKDALGDAESKQNEVAEEFEPKMKELEIQQQRAEVEGYLAIMQANVSRANARRMYSDTMNSLSMNTDSPEFIDSQIGTSQTAISEMQNELASLEAQNLADPDNQLGDAIDGLKQQIASAQVEVKNLRLQRLASWKTGFGNDMDDMEIKYLQERVNLGGAADDGFLARDLRVRELQERKNVVDTSLAARRAELLGYSEGSSEYEQIMADIRDLTKQSLTAQLGIQDELKAQIGGTFNLPEGVQVMSQYDYMAGKGTHSNMSVQAGDMYVNVTLPNVTGSTSSQQLANIGSQLGQGVAQARTNQMRSQLNSAPWGYKTY